MKHGGPAHSPPWAPGHFFLRGASRHGTMLAMRNFLPALFLLAVVSVLTFIPAPVGPSAAFALDDPALADGGGIVGPTDGGVFITQDTGRSMSWQMALTCPDAPARYRMCEVYAAPTDAGQGSCGIDQNYQPIVANRTMDIPVPANRRYLSLLFPDGGLADAGAPYCNVEYVYPRTLPE